MTISALALIALLIAPMIIGHVIRAIGDRPARRKPYTREQQLARHGARKLAAYDRNQRARY